MKTQRKVIDCRQYPSDTHCTLTIAGKKDQVLDVAVWHAITVHGHENSPELREKLRAALHDEKA